MILRNFHFSNFNEVKLKVSLIYIKQESYFVVWISVKGIL